MTEPVVISRWDTRIAPAFAPGKDPLPSLESLECAERWLSRGVPIVIPTETVYGLAAPALDEAAVRAVFEIKGRPLDNPLIVHLTREEHLGRVGAVLSPLGKEFARRFWPGPLTLVVTTSATLPWVTAGLDSVALRHPDHAFAAALIERVGPLAAPSANLSGRPSPTRAWHAARDLSGLVPLVIDGGDLEHGLESTVLDVRGATPVLLRPGALPLEALQLACAVPISTSTKDEAIRSPGMKYRHYSPRAEIWLYPALHAGSGPRARRLAEDASVLCSSGRRVAAIAQQPVNVERFIQQPADLRELGRHLFGWLRELDELGVDCILIEGVSRTGVGRAIMDRLTRAASRVRDAAGDARLEQGSVS